MPSMAPISATSSAAIFLGAFQLARQLKGHRNGQFAEFSLLGLLDGNRQLDSVSRQDVMVKGFLNPLFQ